MDSRGGAMIEEAPIVELCERCGSEGRLLVEDGRFQDGSPRERDLGECPECEGEGLVYLAGVPRSRWDEFALHDHFDEAFQAISNSPAQTIGSESTQ